MNAKTIALLTMLVLFTGCGAMAPLAKLKAEAPLTHQETPPPGADVDPGDGEGTDLGDDPLHVPADAGRQNDGSITSGNGYATVAYLPQLDAIEYWETYQELRAYDSIPVTIAVLDDNFNDQHPDIRESVLKTYNFAAASCGTAIDAVNSTACRDVFADPSTTTAALGEFNHGTNIAGVIAGRGQYGQGVIGVNPSAKLVLLKRDAANDNLRALKAAIDFGVDVISMSWPLGNKPGDKDVAAFKALLAEAASKNIVVVMAAGNTTTDVNAQAIFPTRYSTIDGVIAVGATKNDVIASYSNFGATYVTQSAPGTVVTAGGDYAGGLYSVASGTSFSGPMIAGAASRAIQYLKAKGRAYTAADIERILEDGARKNAALAGAFQDGNQLHMPSLLSALKAAH